MADWSALTSSWLGSKTTWPVRSIPWLAEFMNRHPDQEVELRYSRERSLARRAALSDLERS